jgi:glc operon protein GlcG
MNRYTAIRRGAVRVAMAGSMLLGASLAVHAQAVLKRSLASAAAKRAVAACEALALEKGWKETIAVLDEAGNQLAFLKMDGAALNTIDFALGKARTALRIDAPSTDLLDRLAKGQSQVLAWGLLPGKGGLPIRLAGETIGAIGVSGSGSDNDEICARAGLEAAVKSQ